MLFVQRDLHQADFTAAAAQVESANRFASHDDDEEFRTGIVGPVVSVLQTELTLQEAALLRDGPWHGREFLATHLRVEIGQERSIRVDFITQRDAGDVLQALREAVCGRAQAASSMTSKAR